MPPPKPIPKLDELLDTLRTRDVAALYLGSLRLLFDLQELQASGKRIPGGYSTRIEAASQLLGRLERGLKKLAKRDPARMLDVLEFLAMSSASILPIIDTLREITRRG